MDLSLKHNINSLKTYSSFDSNIFLLKTLKDIYTIVYSNTEISPDEKLNEIKHVFDNLRNSSKLISQPKGTLFSNTFNNISILGEGGYGLVYKGTHYLDNNEYAIKRLPIYISLKESNNVSSLILEKLREIRCLSKLKHPNIISYNTSWLETDNEIYRSEFDQDMDDEYINEPRNTSLLLEQQLDTSKDALVNSNKFIKFHLFYQMEIMDCSLKEILSNEHLRNATNYKTILTGVLNALVYLHAQSLPIIHLDIKPENILLRMDNKGTITSVKLADFGLTHQITCIEPKNKIGTELYSSPERKKGILHTGSDIYSLGIILCEMIYLWKTDMEKIKEIQKIKLGITKIDKFPIINNMIDSDYKKRPSAKKLLQLCDTMF